MKRTIVILFAWLIVFVEVISNIAYIGIFFRKVTIPLQFFYGAIKTLPIIILIGFFSLLLVTRFLKPHPVFRILFFVGITPLCCWNTFCAVMWQEYPLSSVKLGKSDFYLTIGVETGDSNISCYLYQCNAKGLECKSTNLTTYVENNVCRHQPQLIADEVMNELHILTYDWDKEYHLAYTYGDQVRRYLDKAEIEGETYYLAYYHDLSDQNAPYVYMLYKCTQSYSCQRLPFAYTADIRFKQYYLTDLEINDSNNGFDIMIDNQLIYTYDKHPRCYVESCSLQDK